MSEDESKIEYLIQMTSRKEVMDMLMEDLMEDECE